MSGASIRESNHVRWARLWGRAKQTHGIINIPELKTYILFIFYIPAITNMHDIRPNMKICTSITLGTIHFSISGSLVLEDGDGEI